MFPAGKHASGAQAPYIEWANATCPSGLAAGAGNRTGTVAGSVRCQVAGAGCHARGPQRGIAAQRRWWSVSSVPGGASPSAQSDLVGCAQPPAIFPPILEIGLHVLAQPVHCEKWVSVVG
ncbi:hypothetical protein TIFTF001_014072 [Ficus carica]|uniref:Uncharacterized protein n=1 Tax=Ficus carica TaxID=3494 RepID=A0AA88A332_FICCA|nr:hypothetical protein TIFTF001_014072 [Ficus carica]